MEHASTDDGENLYGTTGNPSFSEAVSAWTAERANYDGQEIGDPNLDFGAVGHYTQVVWPETTQVGMGMARGQNGWTYVVGRYWPAGNVSGLSAWRGGEGGGQQEEEPPKTGGGEGKKGGFYLVNSYKDGQASSGIAWYNGLGGNDGQRPDKYVDVKKGGVVTWEGATHTGELLTYLTSFFVGKWLWLWVWC